MELTFEWRTTGGTRDRAQAPVEIAILGLELLHRNHVGAVGRGPFDEALARGRADAVQIERNDSKSIGQARRGWGGGHFGHGGMMLENPHSP